MIGLRGAFGSGGVCDDGERLRKCSSLIVDGEVAATSSRSPQSMDDRFVGCIWANVDGTGGVNAKARGDNSGVVGVLDIANSTISIAVSQLIKFQHIHSHVTHSTVLLFLSLFVISVSFLRIVFFMCYLVAFKNSKLK